MTSPHRKARDITCLSQQLHHDLERHVAARARRGGADTLEALVLRHGRQFRSAAPAPSALIGPVGEGFTNALQACLKDRRLHYCFGFARSQDVPDLMIPHAWAITSDGIVIGPTWDFDDPAGYVGVRMSLAEVPSLGEEIGCFELIRSLLAREPSSRHYRGDA